MTDADRAWGVYHRTCYALALFPLDVVHRSTIRAMLPTGRVRNSGVQNHLANLSRGDTGRKNVVTVKFQDALRRLERLGYLNRGHEFLRIIDRQAMLDEALEETTSVPKGVLNIGQACREVESAIALAHRTDSRMVELRRQELIALHRMLTEAPAAGEHHSGRGSVRLVPKGHVI